MVTKTVLVEATVWQVTVSIAQLILVLVIIFTIKVSSTMIDRLDLQT